MTRATFTAVGLVAALASAALADMAPWDEIAFRGTSLEGLVQGASASGSISRVPNVRTASKFDFDNSEPTTPGFINATSLGNILTIAHFEQDWDKDGWVDAAHVGECNPTGYVVFDFRNRMRNQRVSMRFGLEDGQLLSVGLGPHTGTSARAAPGDIAPWAPYGPNPLGPDTPLVPSDGPHDGRVIPTIVPEPTTAAILCLGAVVCVLHKHSRKRTLSQSLS